MQGIPDEPAEQAAPAAAGMFYFLLFISDLSEENGIGVIWFCLSGNCREYNIFFFLRSHFPSLVASLIFLFVLLFLLLYLFLCYISFVIMGGGVAGDDDDDDEYHNNLIYHYFHFFSFIVSCFVSFPPFFLGFLTSE